MHIRTFAQANLIEIMSLQLNRMFDGNFEALPRAHVFSTEFLPIRYLECVDCKRAYVASCPRHIVGGRLAKRSPSNETLLMIFNDELAVYPRQKFGIDSNLPVRFVWLALDGRLREARVYGRGDRMRSLAITGYSQRGSKHHILAHRLLAWTFKCPYSLSGWQWNEHFDTDHIDEDHGNNRLSNVQLWRRDGSDGHRASAGRLGGNKKARLA